MLLTTMTTVLGNEFAYLGSLVAIVQHYYYIVYKLDFNSVLINNIWAMLTITSDPMLGANMYFLQIPVRFSSYTFIT